MIWKPFVLSLSQHAFASFEKRCGFVSNFSALHFEELSANGSRYGSLKIVKVKNSSQTSSKHAKGFTHAATRKICSRIG